MSWLQLTLHADHASADKLSELLEGLGAASVTLQDAADQPLFEPPLGTTPLWKQTDVVALFPSEFDMEAVYQALQQAQQTLNIPDWETAPLEDQDWERAWMDDFKPMRFGERLWIVPSWHEPPDPAAVNLLLDPGLAFGTGTHPTTALCLEWLDGQDVNGKQIIDFGCGSGILAIAAARLGAAHVLCTDIDPQALQATRDNAERNQVTSKIEAFLPEHVPATRADILLANILAGPLEELAPVLAGHVKPGGLIVLSGILAEQAEHLIDIYAACFKMEPIIMREDWARLSGVRRSG